MSESSPDFGASGSGTGLGTRGTVVSDPTGSRAAHGGSEGVAAMAPVVSGRRRFIRRFKQNRGAVLALGFLLLLAVVALMPGVLAPHDPNEQHLADALADPFGGGYLLGTDELGRDTLSRLIFSTRVALLASLQAVLIGAALGVLPGLVAGYFGRWVDLAIMRVTDTVQSFPPLILAIAIVGVMGPGLRNAMLAIGIIFAPLFVRITRAAVLEVSEETYVEASRSIGTSTWRIMWTRVLPNALPALLVQISLAFGLTILAEAALSFVGLGAQLPDASWGSMLRRGYEALDRQVWLIVFPGVMIALTVLAFNTLGDGLRDAIGRETRRE